MVILVVFACSLLDSFPSSKRYSCNEFEAHQVEFKFKMINRSCNMEIQRRFVFHDTVVIHTKRLSVVSLLTEKL